MLHSTITILSGKDRRNASLSLEPLVEQAVNEAVARQKALGLPNYYSKNGIIYGRAPNGRFVSTKR